MNRHLVLVALVCLSACANDPTAVRVVLDYGGLEPTAIEISGEGMRRTRIDERADEVVLLVADDAAPFLVSVVALDGDTPIGSGSAMATPVAGEEQLVMVEVFAEGCRQCELGECQTTEDLEQTCARGASDCLEWVFASCPEGEICSDGLCVGCGDGDCCVSGATRCTTEGEVQSCDGGAWGPPSACGVSGACIEGQCQMCDGCTIDTTACAGGGQMRCDAVGAAEAGCTAWVLAQVCECTSGECCERNWETKDLGAHEGAAVAVNVDNQVGFAWRDTDEQLWFQWASDSTPHRVDDNDLTAVVQHALVLTPLEAHVVFTKTGALRHATSSTSGAIAFTSTAIPDARALGRIFLVAHGNNLHLLSTPSASAPVEHRTFNGTAWSTAGAGLPEDAEILAVTASPLGITESVVVATRELSSDRGSPVLRVYGYRGGTWELLLDGQPLDLPGSAAIAVDEIGQVHLAYSGQGENINYVRFTPEERAWPAQPITTLGERTSEASMIPGLAIGIEGTTALVVFENASAPAQMVRLVEGQPPAPADIGVATVDFIPHSFLPQFVMDSARGQHVLLSGGFTRGANVVRYLSSACTIP